MEAPLGAAPRTPTNDADVQALADAIRAATADAIDALARTLLATADTHPFGATEFKIRDLAQGSAAKAIEQHLAPKNGYQGARGTCPHGDRAAEFHSHRTHPPAGLVGPGRQARAYSLGRSCGKGLFPFDQQAGLTARHLTPGLERVVTRAGTIAASLEKAAEVVQDMAGTRLSEATVARTTEAAGPRLAQAVQAGQTFGPKVVWPWHQDQRGRRCASIELDAPGVRQQGEGGHAAQGRRAYVGMVGNPCPEWPWPEEKRPPMQARYPAGLYPLGEIGPLLRTPAGQVGMDQAECRLGLTDGGNGLDDRLEENFPWVEEVILDVYHPAEKLPGLSRVLHPQEEERA